VTGQKENLVMCIEKAQELIDKGKFEQVLAILTPVSLKLPKNLVPYTEEDKQHYALFFQLLAKAKFSSTEEHDSQEIINDLDKSLSFASTPNALQLKAKILFSIRNSDYINLHQQAIEAEDSSENNLKYIVALEKNNQHSQALNHFTKLLKTHSTPGDIAEVKRFLKETGRDKSFKDSGRLSAYQNIFYNKYPAQKKRSRTKKRKPHKQLKGMFVELGWPLLSGLLAGLYVSVFYITNNLT
jgi:hypothetical protein